ncbi:LuxR family transcriptional regulator [Streptomyces sp. TG1A-8]|uniref:helix-turn-helix transcriptional regulator n=1 Tax=Streptomyces sp. TG1A-8 TaxID=3051385 RepID=UPI00265C4EFE|nr:LuxR family transcriptional regulator [Streptomyces sp. TG1A-8]MDO0924380.1 LuxR family transcriptional regulator [Streptomyces sp. TG1A-8]
MDLLERKEELALAATALRQAREGRGSLLVVQGPLGTGKSSFLEAVAELARDHGAVLLRAQAAEAEEGFAYGVMRQLVDSAVCVAADGEAERWLGAGAAAVPDVPAASPDTAWECPWAGPENVRRWLTAVLDAMADDGTVMLLVDDVHWSDTESLRALVPALTRRHDRRMLFVVSVMAGDVRGDRSQVRHLLGLTDHTIGLSTFGPGTIRRLAEHTFGQPAEEEFAEALRVRSGGNPLLLRTLLDEARFRGLRPTAGYAAAARTLRPDRVRQRLAAFLRSQPDHVRRAAYALAVLDRAADVQLMAHLAELDERQQSEAVHILGLAGLVDERTCTLTSGTVLRDLLDESMPDGERAAMRGVAAELLHRSGYPAELAAEQLMSVMTLHGREAVGILHNAADSALGRGSPRDAARYLRRALLDPSCAGADRAHLLIDLASAERSFATAASLRHVVEAVPLLTTVRERAAAVVRLGPLLMDPASFRIDLMMRRVAGELRSSPAGDAVDRDLDLRLRAREHYLSAQDPVHIRDTLRHFRALGPRPPLRTTGERELLTSLIHIAFVANAAPAAELAELATRLLELEAPTPEHVHTTLPLVVNILAAADRTDGAAGWLRRAHRLAQRRGGDVEQAVIRAEQALVALADGHLGYAREKVLQADALAGPEMSGLPTICAAILAIVALNTGEPELAEQILVQHRLSAENQHLAALLHVSRGTVAARRGDARTALDHFRTAGVGMEQIGWLNPATLPWPSCAALMHHRLGEHEEALATAHLEVARARTWGAPITLGRALVVLGRVTPGRRGAEVLEEAVAVLEQGSNGYELCRAQYALGVCPETEPARRRLMLQKAYDTAAECDAHWLMGKIHREKRSLESTDITSRLTPSERRVAQRAASGLSNSEISTELNISSRMVEKHLTNSYRKLGIPGRSSLAAVLGRAGEATES